MHSLNLDNPSWTRNTACWVSYWKHDYACMAVCSLIHSPCVQSLTFASFLTSVLIPFHQELPSSKSNRSLFWIRLNTWKEVPDIWIRFDFKYTMLRNNTQFRSSSFIFSGRAGKEWWLKCFAHSGNQNSHQASLHTWSVKCCDSLWVCRQPVAIAGTWIYDLIISFSGFFFCHCTINGALWTTHWQPCLVSVDSLSASQHPWANLIWASNL